MQQAVSHEVSAGIVVYRRTNEGPKFLLLYHGGRYWNFPKGHIEPLKTEGGNTTPLMETSFRAAVRETCEETGLKESDLRFRRGFKAYERYLFNKGKTRVSKTVIFYLAETRERQVKISEEHEGFGWFKYRDALRLLNSYRENEAVIKRAHNFISHPRPVPSSSETQRSS
ncbi:MAG: NUDIX domain-containing protein [Patescibacteria group bacterium]|nr:NUDIX domain-containing protein [Patescibacteria group bacterium]MCL5224069.1 NUDIX domain-containing protein [Patescibacteria group bacterium]